MHWARINQVVDWIETLSPHWLWLILGLILATAEIIVPGFFLIWFAAAAVVTGIISLIVPIPIAGQIGLFAILAVITVYGARRWFMVNPIASSDPNLNNRGARLIGEIVLVVEAIEDGQGRVKVGDSVWSASGPDAAIGAKVRVTGGNGSRLNVELI